MTSSDKYKKHFLLSWKLVNFFRLRFSYADLSVITLPIFPKCMFFLVTKEICINTFAVKKKRKKRCYY